MAKPGSKETKQAAAMRVAAEATAEEKESRVVPETVTLSNGIVLKVKPVPPFLVRAAVTKLEKPKIPFFHNDEKGRDEPNPSDPAYLDDLEEYEEQTTEVGTNVLLVAGTEVAEVPEGCYGPDDQSWKELAEFFEIEVNTDKPMANYLNYLKWYALASAEDLVAVLRPLMIMTGLTEEEVQKAAEGFRSQKTRRTNNGISS